jgi:hypothetical protein
MEAKSFEITLNLDTLYRLAAQLYPTLPSIKNLIDSLDVVVEIHVFFDVLYTFDS